MNWWSAFTWCESIGGKFISFSDLCPDTPTQHNMTNGACPNVTGIAGNFFGWTRTGWGTNSTLAANFSSGKVSTWDFVGGRTDTGNGHRAICEE